MTPPDAAPPTTPPARRPRTLLQRATDFLVSPKLAIALLVVVLLCCIIGVTVVRGARAGELIFATLWFNGLLVLLAVSAGAAFFSRIWKRKRTILQVGMILFHLSFMALLGGVVVNSLFSFHGVLRLTEGETLPNGQPESYDQAEHGRFFDYGRLRGETTLLQMHRDYKVDGVNKRAAYHLAVGEGDTREEGVIYVTEYRDFGGIRFFCAKEGYSVLLVMADKAGTEIYGAHVPLQSLRQADGSRLYVTGSATEAGSFPFPPPPAPPRAEVLLTYWPSMEERGGQVSFKVRPPGPPGPPGAPAAEKRGMVPVGQPFDAGDFTLTPREIRYWVGMDVRYDPGLAVILGSLGTGLIGMFLTLVGRLRQGFARKQAAA